MKVFVSWSGGKDCSYARYLAENSGLEVKYLLNMVSEDGKLSWSHNMPAEILEAQAQAMGVPLIMHRTDQANYEAEYKKAIGLLKKQGITGGVFGDIDFEPHREWVTRVCNDSGVEPMLPLWGLSQDKIMADFVATGHKAMVVVTKAELMGEEWLGRIVDESFIRDLSELRQMKNITACGEAGEYHSLVINGPLFKKKMVIQETSKSLREGYWLLDIKKYELKEK
ncbi:MAG: diphthine--ammonia ligase [Dehalococcoidales bacterium]|nr:diphthine--ammonia ligase [Dehalococcoidales bacterium]